MRSVYRTVVMVKKELSRKAKLSIYRSIYVPTLTYGHELWVMTERTRSADTSGEMSFLRRVAGRSLRDRGGVPGVSHREKAPVEDPGHAGETMSLGWPGNAFGDPPPEELEEVSGVREVWASLLRLLPPRPGPGPSG
ncbi:hypothetical protein L3Q82_022667 [Scortum barcoo]|uniref:Uncharacterized protein n=1 Tax=Scortum barcoo TaxID=214431 RepID=A0ACB8WWX8_9TELE|nr:hypothetical protein L3Q82_022667 [Scortum barcoo]